MPVTVICERCGNAFSVKPTKATTARYCSRTCRRHRVVLVCEWCKRDFEMFASRKHQRYCSRQCASLAKSGDLYQRVYEGLDRSGGPDACWPWAGHCDDDGYGIIKFRDKVCKVHRVSYEMANGSIAPGLPVCHSCDNPPCGNPAHLRQDTYAANVADQIARSRKARGERANRGSLTEADVRTIRALASEESYRTIAQRFGVSNHAIYCIVHHKTWAHVD